MKMSKSKALFYPGYDLPESDTFYLPVGGQVTVVAMGLMPGDEVSFEMIFAPAIQPDLCACPPGIVELPSVAASAPMMCCGEPIKLTADNPFVVMDAPQGVRVRGVMQAALQSGIWVWAFETDTKNVTDRLRGCPCN